MPVLSHTSPHTLPIYYITIGYHFLVAVTWPLAFITVLGNTLQQYFPCLQGLINLKNAYFVYFMAPIHSECFFQYGVDMVKTN